VRAPVLLLADVQRLLDVIDTIRLQ
jgi:hypothetical protein